MKRLFLFLFLAILGSTSFAQQLPINIGIRAGISNNKMSTDLKQITDIDSKTGYMFGAFARFNLGIIYLEPGLNFNHRESSVKDIKDEYTLKYNSVDVPMMIGAYIFKFPVFKLRAYTGPVASFPGNIKDNKLDFKSKNFVWNGKIGAGVDLWKLTFDIDYEKGFSSFEEDLKSPRTFNFTLGFKII